MAVCSDEVSSLDHDLLRKNKMECSNGFFLNLM
jgi:hypothetical protein